MTAGAPGLALAAAWRRVRTGDGAVAVAERAALGTSARVAVWPPDHLGAACAATDDVLAALDKQASRFRPDSELSWLHRSGGGLFALSDGLAEAVGVALAAARWTGGLTDPTVGEALACLGYDRDFAAIGARGDPPGPPGPPVPAPGWELVRLDGPLLAIPAGIRLDLGATAKGLGSDRAVRAVMAATGQSGGVLVSLGGDIAVAGPPPARGWAVGIARESGAPLSRVDQVVAITRGGLASSATSVRAWRLGTRAVHHIVDPRTGDSAEPYWSLVSATGASCVDANVLTTAAVVWGPRALDELARSGHPCRLVRFDGRVTTLNGWPHDEVAA